MPAETPLDPQIAEILRTIDQRPVPLWELPMAEARRVADEGMVLLRQAFGVEEVAEVTDRSIDAATGRIPVRVYRPEGSGPHGVLVYAHGGGYVFCSLDTHDQLCRMLCNRGRCIVVSVDYRLAPEHPFPAGVEDVWAATRWVQDHAIELGGDPARVAIGGDSAGGNFAAVVALHNRADARPRLQLQVLLYPSTDRRGGYPSLVENGEGYLLTSAMRQWFARCYLPDSIALDDWRLSPLCAPAHDGAAPALMVTAQYDPLRDEGDAYAEVLRTAGVPVTHVRAAGMIHGFLQYAPFHAGARSVLDEVGAVLRRALA